MLPTARLLRNAPSGLSGRGAAAEWREVCAFGARRIPKQVLSVSIRSSIDDPFGASPPEMAAGVDVGSGDLDRRSESDRCSCGFGVEGSEHVYNEEAFRYFLEIERKRSQVSNRPFLLLLLDLRPAGPRAGIDETSSVELFTALCRCLRDTAFIGWYRAGAVVGAVLTEHCACMPDAQSRVSCRG